MLIFVCRRLPCLSAAYATRRYMRADAAIFRHYYFAFMPFLSLMLLLAVAYAAAADAAATRYFSYAMLMPHYAIIIVFAITVIIISDIFAAITPFSLPLRHLFTPFRAMLPLVYAFI